MQSIAIINTLLKILKYVDLAKRQFGEQTSILKLPTTPLRHLGNYTLGYSFRNLTKCKPPEHELLLTQVRFTVKEIGRNVDRSIKIQFWKTGFILHSLKYFI